ncbi:extracellular catalytic domain type 1 short-chain-length polyhydroxyalkanoate depolymerase [Streptomyces lomondensis]|uniref:Poly(3-hydroxyalkanoate) depolymerase n=1 Tax=Streptomyces lomondensis TaxID=68229 RepID=A0ABQ2XSG1_9ACTN|nr:PHB depolymerase family esterase [Streptomyces lomondensis]MCF0080878.1 feruloyl esterase [Streptomyces lomondensis]GGX30977.1 poly(3-hydroxyalkanoate) depolymerase [Streptomyces lomondensis]
MNRPKAFCAALTAVCALFLPAAVPSAAAVAQGTDGGPPRAGCDLKAGRTTLSVTSGGLQRTVLVHVPPRLEGHGHLPMVLNLHSSQSRALWQIAISQMEQTADREGFVLVAPQGAVTAGPGYRWNVPHVSEPGGPDDERFLSDTIDTLTRSGCADPRRVYATGYSGGARMVSQYACDHPGRLAAIAVVAGLRAGAPVKDASGTYLPDPSTCRPHRALPVLSFSGTADTVNPHNGGGFGYWGYGAETAQRRWAALNGCRLGPRTVQVTEHVSRVTHSACRRGARVSMYVIDGGGHTWPGSTIPLPPDSGPVNPEISANDVMWRFFAAEGRSRLS